MRPPREVEAMQYVASHTTIPVPRIYTVHTDGHGHIYIEMAYVKGVTLHSAWSGLSKDQKIPFLPTSNSTYLVSASFNPQLRV
jgi:hypothetical protein